MATTDGSNSTSTILVAVVAIIAIAAIAFLLMSNRNTTTGSSITIPNKINVGVNGGSAQ